MGLTHEGDILIADRPEDFAREVIRLYQDEDLGRRLAEKARNLVAERYSYANAARYWDEVFEVVDGERVPREHRDEETEEKREAASAGKTGYCWLPKRPDIVPESSIVIPVSGIV